VALAFDLQSVVSILLAPLFCFVLLPFFPRFLALAFFFLQSIIMPNIAQLKTHCLIARGACATLARIAR
jgi:hypothetical protein